MNRRVTQNNKYHENGGEEKLKIKGVYIVRLLVGFLLALNLLLLYAIFFSSHGLAGYRNQTDQVRDLEGKILKLKQDNQRLFDMIQALKTNPKAQERLVRKELGWARENEMILEFPEKESEPGNKTTGSAKPGDPAK